MVYGRGRMDTHSSAVQCTAPFLAYTPSHTHTPSSTKFLRVVRTGEGVQHLEAFERVQFSSSHLLFTGLYTLASRQGVCLTRSPQDQVTRSPQNCFVHELASELANALASGSRECYTRSPQD